MATPRDMKRRWICLGLLTIACAMLVAGMTILDGRLGGKQFIIYWMICFLFTSAAMMGALLDVRAIRLQAMREQKELLEKTVLRKMD